MFATSPGDLELGRFLWNLDMALNRGGLWSAPVGPQGRAGRYTVEATGKLREGESPTGGEEGRGPWLKRVRGMKGRDAPGS